MTRVTPQDPPEPQICQIDFFAYETLSSPQTDPLGTDASLSAIHWLQKSLASVVIPRIVSARWSSSCHSTQTFNTLKQVPSPHSPRKFATIPEHAFYAFTTCARRDTHYLNESWLLGVF
jgi:hypothetical protein